MGLGDGSLFLAAKARNKEGQISYTSCRFLGIMETVVTEIEFENDRCDKSWGRGRLGAKVTHAKNSVQDMEKERNTSSTN